MAIKSTVQKPASVSAAQSFPWIGTRKGDHGFIVLFTGHSRGVCLAHGEKPIFTPIGGFDNDWDMSVFEPLVGGITLENDNG